MSRLSATGGVDAAARIHSSVAGPVMMRNTLPPPRPNDLLGAASEMIKIISVAPARRKSHDNGSKTMCNLFGLT
jgi:hypothetical protein